MTMLCFLSAFPVPLIVVVVVIVGVVVVVFFTLYI